MLVSASNGGEFLYTGALVTLEATEVFRGLPPADLKALQGVARERTFVPGQIIFREGDAGDGFYLIQEGTVEISGRLADNQPHVFSELKRGDLFGEMSVLEDKPRSATAVARQPTRAFFFARTELLPLIEKSPQLSLLLVREISARLREFNRQYLEEVLQTERLAIVGRFARSIVHDLKNPLNVIGLTAELIGSANSSPETRQQAPGRIRKQVEKISDMISEILDFTQGSDSKVVLAPLEYGTFAEHVLNEITPEAALKSVHLEVQNPAPANKVLLDPKRLRRVFYNLVNNATDAMPDGGKVIIRFKAENGHILTEVEDTGPGIAPEVAERLFEAFVTFGKAHGTGLGLSICKRIVEDHRGWISARNSNGSGALFTFALPVVAA